MTRSALFVVLVALSLPLAGCLTTSVVSEASGVPDQAVEIAGVWTYSVDSPGGGDEGTFTITGEPGEYEGEIIAQGQLIPLADVLLNGSELSFLFRVGNGPFVRCAGVVTDDAFEGTADAGQFGTFPMMATR